MIKPIKRLDVITENTANLLTGVRRTLASQKVVQRKESIEENTNYILFKEAVKSGKYTAIGMDLYKESDSLKDLGKIWIKKTFRDPTTGKDEDWLIVYTNDEGEIIRQVASEYRNSKTAAAQPSPKNIPIAPGIKSKNITIDETGGEGSAKVMVEFSDVDKGYEFYKQQGQGGEGEKEPAKEEETEETPAEQPAAPKGPQPIPQQGQVQQPQIQPAQSNLKSTVEVMSHNGQKLVNVIHKESAYIFVNEGGKEVSLNWEKALRKGTQFERPDTGELVRVGEYSEQKEDNKEPKEPKEKKEEELDSDKTIASQLIEEISKISKCPKGWKEPIKEMKKEYGKDSPIPYQTAWSEKKKGKKPWHKKKKKKSSLEFTAFGEDYTDEGESPYIPGGAETPPGKDFEIGDQVRYDSEMGHIGVGEIADCNAMGEYLLIDSGGKEIGWFEESQLIPQFEGPEAEEENFESDTFASKKTAADISDEIPPMGWKTDESKNNAPTNAQPLPQSQNLQQDQQQDNVIYDSKQDSGPQFQTTVNPKDKSVNIKFIDSQEEQALNQAINKAPAQPQQQQQTNAPVQPNQQQQAQQPKPEFQEQNIPTNF